MKTPTIRGYYLKYDDRIIGPIAPDNPRWDFNDPRMLFKCKSFTVQMNKEFGTDYEVIHVDS